MRLVPEIGPKSRVLERRSSRSPIVDFRGQLQRYIITSVFHVPQERLDSVSLGQNEVLYQCVMMQCRLLSALQWMDQSICHGLG